MERRIKILHGKYIAIFSKYELMHIIKEIISSAKHDIGLFTKELEEEEGFLRIQFEENREQQGLLQVSNLNS